MIISGSLQTDAWSQQKWDPSLFLQPGSFARSQHGCARVTDSLGTSELQVKILTRPWKDAVTETRCYILHVLSQRTRHHDAASEWVQILILCWPKTLQHQHEACRLQMRDFAVPARWWSSGLLWFFYFGISEFRGLSISTSLQSDFSFYCEKRIFLLQQLATYMFTVLATPQKSSSQGV